jgi:DNA-binding CsgD family transcriptional regulator/tetratricopeptide (TPR) repeat protein
MGIRRLLFRFDGRRKEVRLTGFDQVESSSRAGKVALRGRDRECAVLRGLVEGVCAGHSAALVLLGEAGVGKTALLRYAIGSAPELRVVRAVGVECEMELAFAALHQLCRPMLGRLEHLPVPQRDALGIAFGIAAGPPPDRFLVGLAVLSLLSEVAGEQPLICIVDDAQWLDQASAQALAFAARRLQAESVFMMFAMRQLSTDFNGLPELVVEGLSKADARELLDSVVRWPLDDPVAERIVAETKGNPLALLELPRDLSPEELAGGFGLPDVLPLSGKIEQSFLRRTESLPEDARRLLVLAAAEPTGDAALMWRAASLLGLRVGAADYEGATGLLEIGTRVRFRHPLVRSAVYQGASAGDRRKTHAALAEAANPDVDPDRRAWHRAQAASAPDEDVAADLERSADRAQARGGLAAAAAFLERSADLTADAGRQAGRALAAARAKYQAGAPEAATELLARAEAGAPDELLRAQIGLLRGQMAFATSNSGEASALLLRTAERLEQIDPKLARETYLDALAAAIFAGRLADIVGLSEVAVAARGAPAAPQPPRAPDLLLDGLAILITDGYAAGVPVVQRAVSAFRSGEAAIEEEFRWSFVACHSAHDLWDDEGWHALSTRYLQLTRNVGALGLLPIAISQRVGMHLHAGEFTAAASLVEETAAITEATRNDLPPYSALALAGWQGRAAEANELFQVTMSVVAPRGEGMGLSLAQYTSAVLNNGLGRYAAALDAADQASAYPQELGFANWGLVELVEAAARSGDTGRAARAVDQLTRTTRHSGTPWGQGIEARSRALISDGDDAELLYREAIEQLGRCRGAVALARAHLIYGEWLRRRNRRADARVQLRTAYEMFTSMQAEAFADRTRRELLATGETVHKRTEPTRDELTPQERQIAWRAREGRTNPEIGAELFLSSRTVEWHLRKVFTKLGITSRRELQIALPEIGRLATSA